MLTAMIALRFTRWDNAPRLRSKATAAAAAAVKTTLLRCPSSLVQPHVEVFTRHQHFHRPCWVPHSRLVTRSMPNLSCWLNLPFIMQVDASDVSTAGTTMCTQSARIVLPNALHRCIVPIGLSPEQAFLRNVPNQPLFL